MASEVDKPRSWLAAGIGLEQLSYQEQIPDIDLTSSDTDLWNWVIHLEGRIEHESFFIGARSLIPLSLDESQEYWTKAGELEQANSLEYYWFRIDAHVGYSLSRLLNPYVGLSWSYAEQERSNFQNIIAPEINNISVEEIVAFYALLGIRGDIPITSAWSISYFAEYQLPFYSNTTNSGAPGWEASNTGGYVYSLAASLKYSIRQNLSVVLKIRSGKQHWDGSDWILIGKARIKWPENDTHFLGGFICIYKQF